MDRNKLPTPTWAALQIFVIWEVYQMLLYKYLPGPIGYGQETPAGTTRAVASLVEEFLRHRTCSRVQRERIQCFHSFQRSFLPPC